MLYVFLELLLVQHAATLALKAKHKRWKQYCWSNSWWRNRYRCAGGTNTADQGISQATMHAQTAACVAGTLTGPACNNTSVQGNTNTGSNTAGQTAGGGTGKGSSGGVNQYCKPRNKPSTIAMHKMQHVLQELLLVQHATIQALKAK